jgi:hypothetical protein
VRLLNETPKELNEKTLRQSNKIAGKHEHIVMELLRGMLAEQPSKRIAARQVLERFSEGQFE